MEEVFLIKSVNNNKFFVSKLMSFSWAVDINSATTFNSYFEASSEINTNNNIPEGMYQIEKIFKKPELKYEE